MAVERLARAKVNLALHVTGQRSDGYHLLDSLVCFAEVGDTVSVEPADDLSLRIGGPMAGSLPVAEDNLVLRAARVLAPGRGARITLIKRLPVASGIGGGSADAAAALLALADLWGVALPPAEAVLALGADLPVCLAGRAARMRGIGELVEPLAAPLPEGWMALVNPGVGVSTPETFKRLARKDNPPLPELPALADLAALADFLADQRNDLMPPALTLAPAIGAALTGLRAQAGCQLARMSGSGATCFGLFAEEAAARAAAAAMQRPGWWSVAARIAG